VDVTELSICADAVFEDRPFADRIRAIRDAGFGVEFWRWTSRSIDELAAVDGVKWTCFVGWVGGSALHPDGVETFLDGARRSLELATRLGCRKLIVTTGELDATGLPIHPVAKHPITRWMTAYRAYSRLAELAARAGVTYCLENLNTKVDHPGYELGTVDDTEAIVRSVDNPHLRLLLDVYHAQVQEGNLIATIERVADIIGHVQVADVPGRHEPGTGEIDFPRVAAAFRRIGYTGTIGLEAFPEGDSDAAIGSFKRAFS
jgi:hydroxypyruvate isomerase